MKKILFILTLIILIFLTKNVNAQNPSASENCMHYVKGSRIFDGNTSKEVI